MWETSRRCQKCTANETINKMKKQQTRGEKIFASHVSDQELISKCYKKLIQLNGTKQASQFKKWVEELNRQFSKEDTQRVTESELIERMESVNSIRHKIIIIQA